MINSFTFSFTTQVEFGNNSIKRLSMLIKEKSYNNVLLIYGQGSIKRNGIYDDVIKELKKCCIRHFEFSGCPQNPTSKFVNNGKLFAINKQVDLVLAVGGGSVIDAAKAIALLLNNQTDNIWDYESKRDYFPNKAIPVGVVLTTAGTGSEVNGGFVISNVNTFDKIGFINLSVRPIFAIYNPEYTYYLNTENTAYNVVDIVSHLLEQYFSEDNMHDYLLDDLIMSTLKNVMINQEKVFNNLESYEGRMNLMMASCISLSYLYSMGKTILWTLHNFAHVLSGLYNVPHGIGIASMLPGWISYVLNNDLYKHKTNILLSDVFLKHNISNKGLNFAVCSWLRSLNLPIDISEIIEDKSELYKICDKILENKNFITKSNYTKRDILSILEASWKIKEA